jgi:hypothetical protein
MIFRVDPDRAVGGYGSVFAKRTKVGLVLQNFAYE